MSSHPSIHSFNLFSRQKKVLSMSISVPELVTVGKYEMSGQAFVPLDNSSGTYKTIFQDVELHGESKLKVQRPHTLSQPESRGQTVPTGI